MMVIHQHYKNHQDQHTIILLHPSIILYNIGLLELFLSHTLVLVLYQDYTIYHSSHKLVGLPSQKVVK
jgi:hypothetical protein